MNASRDAVAPPREGFSTELVLRVGADFGDVSLSRVSTATGWSFTRHVCDQTPLLIDEPSIEHESDVARTWDDALRLMDEYPWHRLSPRFVHPEFRQRVWTEISARALGGLIPSWRVDDWRERCE